MTPTENMKEALEDLIEMAEVPKGIKPYTRLKHGPTATIAKIEMMIAALTQAEQAKPEVCAICGKYTEKATHPLQNALAFCSCDAVPTNAQTTKPLGTQEQNGSLSAFETWIKDHYGDEDYPVSSDVNHAFYAGFDAGRLSAQSQPVQALTDDELMSIAADHRDQMVGLPVLRAVADAAVRSLFTRKPQ